MREHGSGKESPSHQDTINSPQWAPNGKGISSRGGYHGTQASPHLPGRSTIFFQKCVYTQEQKEKQIVWFTSKWSLICLMGTMLTWPGLGPELTVPCTTHLLDFLYITGRQGHGLGIIFALVCLACSSSHLQTTSVFFCKLQKGTPRLKVPTPNQRLRKKDQGQRRGGRKSVCYYPASCFKHVTVMLELQSQAAILILGTHDDWTLF